MNSDLLLACDGSPGCACGANMERLRSCMIFDVAANGSRTPRCGKETGAETSCLQVAHGEHVFFGGRVTEKHNTKLDIIHR